MLNSLAPFIDAGWWTAPLKSPQITRDSRGKKVFQAPKNWNQYKDIFNETPSPVGAVMTGEASGVCVLDCDSESITHLALGIVPNDYQGITKSVGKLGSDQQAIEAVSIFFKFQESYPQTMNNGPMGLEWFNGGSARMVFLPTEGNTTKQPWDKVPELIDCPQALLDLIDAFSQKTQVVTTKHYEATNSTNLAPMLIRELALNRLDDSLFTIITPKMFRHLSRTLHPQDIPKGSGSNYMVRVSAILGADESVDDELYKRFMNYLNVLRKTPADPERLDREIITPMITGTAQIDNQPIWQYNEHWEKDRLTVVSKLGHNMEYLYDSMTKSMYEVNHSRGLVSTISRHQIVEVVSSVSDKKLPSQQLKFMQQLPNYEVGLHPDKPFGPINRYEYNTFKMSAHLETLHNPTEYSKTDEAEEGKRQFQVYMENLIPHEPDRTYLLNHLYTKLMTFQYSAVVYYIVGVPGSGKGTLVRIIDKLIGSTYISKELGKNEITEKYNEWLLGKYFVHFDELHNQMDTREARAANERIKSWTGADSFPLRKMRADSEPNVPMLATFIFTQNGNKMQFDENDRRYLYIDTPNVMTDDLAEFFDDISDEKMQGIAHYIGTSYRLLKHKEYKAPPYSEHKRQQIIDKMPTVDRIMYYIKEEDYDKLFTMVMECGIATSEFLSGQAKNRVYTDMLVKIVEEYHPSYTAVEPRLKILIKEKLSMQPTHPFTTDKGKNRHYIIAHGFSEWYPPIDDTDETEYPSIDIDS